MKCRCVLILTAAHQQPLNHPNIQQHTTSALGSASYSPEQSHGGSGRVGLIWWRGGCPKDGSKGTVGYGGVVAEWESWRLGQVKRGDDVVVK